MLRKKAKEKKVKVNRIGAGTCLRWIPAFAGMTLLCRTGSPPYKFGEEDEKSSICSSRITVTAAFASADTFGTGNNQFDIDFVTISGATNPTTGKALPTTTTE